MHPIVLSRFRLAVIDERSLRSNYKGLACDIRPLRGPGEFNACMKLQAKTWGLPDREIVPENVLVALQDCGLPALGAFDENGQMLATLFGFGGVDPKSQQPILHSHMLAVIPQLRSKGIGTALKIAQAWMCGLSGIHVVEWTVDPLRPNWALNVSVLGAVTKNYRRDLYSFTGDGIYAGFPADRVLIHWNVGSDWVTRRMLGERPKITVEAVSVIPLVGPESILGEILGEEPPRLQLEIPLNIDQLSAEQKLAERVRTRPIFEGLFAAGYTANEFVHDPVALRNFVIFERSFVLE